MADAKITQLTELTSADGADLLAIVDDVAGSPITKKITLTNIASWLASLAQTLVNKTLTSPKINENVVLTSTATELNALDGQTGAWTAFTPSWTNLTLGNGSATGNYCKIGKLVFFRVTFTFGSTSSIGAGVGLTLPVAIKTSSLAVIGAITIYDSSVGAYYGAIDGYGSLRIYIASTTYLSQGSVSTTVPMTWEAGDLLYINGCYEAS